MDNNKQISKTLGLIFIIASCGNWAYYVLPKNFPGGEVLKYFALIWYSPTLSNQGIASSFGDFLLVLFFTSLIFIAGLGLLKSKPWAKIFALLVVTGEILYRILLFIAYEPAFYNRKLNGILLIPYIVLFVILLLPIKKELLNYLKRFKEYNVWARRAISIASAEVIVLFICNILIVLFVMIGSLYLYYSILFPNYKKWYSRYSIIGPTYVEVDYSNRDNANIKKKYSELKIFDFSICTPKDFYIPYASSMGPYGDHTDITLHLHFKLDSLNEISSMINSYTFPTYFEEVYKDHYERERYTIKEAKRTFSRIISLRLFSNPMSQWDVAEEVTAEGWVGLILYRKQEYIDSYSNILVCSAYRKDFQGHARIYLDLGEEEMTIEEAKDMVITLKFFDEIKSYDDYFRTGKEKLNEGNYNEAIFDFTRALHFGPEDPEYYYNLALAFYGLYQRDEEWKDCKFSMVERFLSFALKVNPEYKEAKKMLSVIESLGKEQ